MDINRDFTDQAIRILDGYTEDVPSFILNIDIDNFHSINYLYSVDAGDEFLEQMELFLRHCPSVLHCERTFADFFLCLLVPEDHGDIREIMNDNDAGMQSLIKQFQVKYPACHFKVACGVCQIQDRNISHAIDNANMARKESKKQLTTKAVLYDLSLSKKILSRFKVEQELQNALLEDRFCFYLQPKVSLLDGSIVGAEALVRKINCDGESTGPDAFLEIMEENGEIIALDFMICRQVCQFLSECMRQNKPVLPIAINLSRLHLQNAETAQQLHAIAQEYGIPPYLLEFELTETILLNDFSQAKEIISQLRGYGYHIAIDDFGSGYAGINIWQELDFDLLKLDRRFLSPEDELLQRNLALLPNIIDISKRLNIAVLCEGVETEEQCLYLSQLGCTLVQGFYFAHPMPPQQLLEEYENNGGAYLLPISLRTDLPNRQPVFDEDEPAKKGENRIAKWSRSIVGAAAILILSIALVLINLQRETHRQFQEMSVNTLNAYTQGQRERTLAGIENVEETLKAIAVLISNSPEPDFIDAYLETLSESVPGVTYTYRSFEYYRQMEENEYTKEEDREIFHQLQRGQTIVTDIQYSNRLGGIYCFGVGVPVEKDGEYIGAVRGVVDARTLVSTELYNSAQGEAVLTLLTDKDGVILPVMSDYNIGIGEELPERLSGMGGISPATIASLENIYSSGDNNAHSFFLGTRDGALYYLSVVNLSFNGWHLAVYMKDTAIASMENQIVQQSVLSIAVLLLITIILFGLILLFYRKMQLQISKAEQRYLLLESFADTVLFEFDNKSNILRFTPNASKLIRLDSLEQKNFLHQMGQTHIYPGDFEIVRRLFCGEAGLDSDECRLRIMHPEGNDYFWCLMKCKYIYEGSILVSVVGKLTDIDNIVQNEVQLRRKSEKDGLTGLMNKETVEKAISNQLLQDKCGLLFVFDMDDFKHINDYYGHTAGDLLLRHMGDCLQRTFRSGDIAGRIGGDEMVVYMKAENRTELIPKKVELLRQHMELYKMENDIPCSVSIGVARFPEDGRTYPELFKAADEALYSAKRLGKNQVVIR